MSIPIVDARNIGPRSAAWLNHIGINTVDDLAEIGAPEAFLRVEARNSKYG